MDEVGRGAFAGPLVAAGVVVWGKIEGLMEQCPVPIRDSKTLSLIQRQRIAKYLAHKRVKIEIEEISVREINEKGMGWANKEIFIRLINKMKASKYVIDGRFNFAEIEGKKIESRVKADQKVLQTMLAAIVAKLHRDKLMKRLHKRYPCYNWKANKGYGTRAHREAIDQHGTCCEHRDLWIKTWRKSKNDDAGVAQG